MNRWLVFFLTALILLILFGAKFMTGLGALFFVGYAVYRLYVFEDPWRAT